MIGSERLSSLPTPATDGAASGSSRSASSSGNGDYSDQCEDLDVLLGNRAFRMKIDELELAERYRTRTQGIKVSVVMPTWNRAVVIRRAIDSVLSQRYRNFELIISDDGSSDSTEELVMRHYSGDQRIRYLRNNHAGVSRARNIALSQSTGDLIAYLDSDNVWSEDFLLLMVNTFVDNPTADALYCALRVIDKVNDCDFISFRHYDRGALLSRNYVDMNVFMHKRCLFETLGGFNEELRVLEDWELIVRYTKDKPPHVLECLLAVYYFEKDFEHLSSSEELPGLFNRIRQRFLEG